MSVDQKTIRNIAKLARIRVEEQQIDHLQTEFNSILSFVEQLNEVDVKGVPPMHGMTDHRLSFRKDQVTDGHCVEKIVANAPAEEDGYFLVPKVVE